MAVVGEATEDIEDTAIGLDDAITNTAAMDLAKIEVLELVGFEVGERKDEDARRVRSPRIPERRAWAVV